MTDPPARVGAPLLVRNAGFLAGGEVLERLVGFGIAVWLARALGASLYGMVGIAASVVAFLSIAVDAGTTAIAVREVARSPAVIPALYARIAGLRTVVAVALLAALVLAGPWLARHLGVPPLLLGLYGLGLLPVALACGWAFLGLERMHVVAVGRVLERTVILAGLWWLVRGPAPVLWRVPVVEVGTAAGVVLGMGLWLLRGQRRLRDVPRPSAPRRGRLLGEGAPLALAMFLRMVYIQGDVVLLGALGSAAAAGLFLVSHKLVLTFTGVVGVLQQAALPQTSRWLPVEPDRAVALQAALLRWSLAVLLPVALAGTLVGAPVLELLFGTGYAAAAPVLRIVVWTLPLVAVMAAHRSLLLAAAAPIPQLLAVAAGVAVHVLLAVAWIPASGARGAALSCLIGEAVGAAALVALTHWQLGRSFLSRAAAAPLGAAVLAALPLAQVTWPLGLRLALAAGVYATAALALGAVRRDELVRARAWMRSG